MVKRNYYLNILVTKEYIDYWGTILMYFTCESMYLWCENNNCKYQKCEINIYTNELEILYRLLEYFNNGKSDMNNQLVIPNPFHLKLNKW